MGSWPAVITHAVHPHQLVLLQYLRNSCDCDLCDGPLVGMLGYRCEACDFDVHCTCLPNNTTGTSLTRRTSAPPPPPQPRPPLVSSPWHAAHGGAHGPVIYAPQPPPRPPLQVNLGLSLSGQISHPLGAQTSPVISSAPSNRHDTPGPDYGGAPYPHDHHPQQENNPTTNNQRGASEKQLGDEDYGPMVDLRDDQGDNLDYDYDGDDWQE